MTIRVEFFGIVREKAGVEAATLVEVFAELEARFPKLAAACFENGELRAGYLANIDGLAFTTDCDTPLADGVSVLLLSADAGG